MSQKLELWIQEIKKKHGKRKIWTRVISLMMAVTVFTTTYALILPALTMDKTYCGIEEHTHSVENGCYTEHKTLICTQEETTEAGHVHTDDCYEEQSVLACTLAEAEGHAHSEECYDEEGVLICTLEESDGHQHSEDCDQTEKVLVCGQEETDAEADAHVHTDACYETALELICEKEEHEHTKVCYSDKDADVETAAAWEKSISGVKLTGNWAKDVLAVADSQLGYTESVRNYLVEEDGTVKGYTRYGAWYGSPYGDWCAMFVSFCLNYAQVDRELMPIDANCGTWLDKLEEMKVYHRTGNGDDKSVEGYTAPEEYTPEPGDLIFFDWENDGDVNHVGLVYELIKDEEGNLGKVKTIEGNSADTVKYNTYDLTDEVIMGYGELPENPNPDKEPGKVGEADDPEPSPMPGEKDEITLSVETDNYVTVTMKAPKDAFDVPAEELSLSAVAIDDEKAKELLENEAAANDGESVKRTTMLFNIDVLHNGEVVQPKKPVQVSFSGIETPKDDAQVFHVDTEKEVVEEVTAEQEENGDIIMEAPHFSIYGVTYTVDFHFGEYDFSILGLDSITLSELFSALQIDKNAADAIKVEFSDPALVTVEKITDDWKLTSLQAFTTEETLKIELSNGDEFVITVTDAPASGIGENYVANTGTLAVNVSKITGTTPWDADDSPGNDSSPNNDVVRSFDTIYYKVGYTMNLIDKYQGVFKGYKKVNMYFEAILPLPKEQAEFALDAMPWLTNAKVTSNTNSQTLRGYYAMDAGNLDYILPSTGTVKLAVNVKNMANGTTVQPTIKAWLDAGNKRNANPSATMVSSKENYDVSLEEINSASADSNTHLYKNYAIVVRAGYGGDEKGSKGSYIQTDGISFDLNASYLMTYNRPNGEFYKYEGNTNETTLSTYTPRLYDYSLVTNITTLTGTMGKDLSIFGVDVDKISGRTTLPYSAREYGNLTNSVCGSGTMTATQGYNGDQRIHIKFSGIENDLVFPTTVASRDRDGNLKKLPTLNGILAVGIIQLEYIEAYWTPNTWSDGSIYNEKYVANISNQLNTEFNGNNKSFVDSFPGDNKLEYQNTGTITLMGSGQNIGLFNMYGENTIVADTFNAKKARGTEFYIRTYSGSGMLGHNTTGSDCLLYFNSEIYEPICENSDDVIAGLQDECISNLDTPGWKNPNVQVKIYYLSANPYAVDMVDTYTLPKYTSMSEARAAGVTPNMIYIELRSIDTSIRYENYITPCSFIKFKIRDDAPITPKTPIPYNNRAWNAIFLQSRMYCDGNGVNLTNYTLANYTSRQSYPYAYRVFTLHNKGVPSTINCFWYEKMTLSFPGLDGDGNFIGNSVLYLNTVYNNGVVGSVSNWGTWFAPIVTIVTDKEVGIKKDVSQQIDGKTREKFTLDNGDYNVDYTLTPRLFFENVTPNVARYSEVTITDTLPKELTYVPNSTYIGGTYNQPANRTTSGTVTGGTNLQDNGTVTGLNTTTNSIGDVTMSATKNTDGTTTLKWVITNVQAGKDMPKIYYSTKIGNGENLTAFQDGQQLTNTVTIDSRSSDDNIVDNRGAKTATSTITISKLDKATLIKSVETPEVDLDEDITFTINYTNDSGSAITSMDILDLLPYNGDARGSKFSGSYTVDRVTVERTNEAAGTYAMGYTTDTSVQGHETDVFAAGFNPAFTNATGSVSGNKTTFTLPANTSPTMLKFTGTNIAAYAQVKITITLHPTGNKDKDVYLNDTACNAPSIPQPVYAVPVQAKVKQQHFTLEVSKTLSPADLTDKFPFTVDLTKEENQTTLRHVPLPADCSVVDGNGDPVQRTITISQEGRVTVELGHDEKLVISNIPYGYTATITEAEDTRFETTYTVDGGAATTAGRTASVTMDADKTVGYTNTRAVTDLTIKKTVVGNYPDDTFQFSIVFTDNTVINRIPDDTNNPARYTKANDRITFDLKGGEQVTIPGIPIGTELTLTETKHDGFTASIYYLENQQRVLIEQGGEGKDNAKFTLEDAKTVEVINNPGVALPSTGGTGTTIYTISGLLVMAAAVVGTFSKRRRRERRYE